jgi:hypothetical protein
MRRNVWSSLRGISSGGGVAYLAKAIANTLHTVGPMSQNVYLPAAIVRNLNWIHNLCRDVLPPGIGWQANNHPAPQPDCRQPADVRKRRRRPRHRHRLCVPRRGAVVVRRGPGKLQRVPGVLRPDAIRRWQFGDRSGTASAHWLLLPECSNWVGSVLGLSPRPASAINVEPPPGIGQSSGGFGGHLWSVSILKSVTFLP